MAKDVHATLLRILADQAWTKPAEAELDAICAATAATCRDVY